MDQNIDLLRSRLTDYLNDFDIESTEYQTFQLLEHLRLLFAINESLNLTRITSYEESIVKHLLDSALFVHILRKHQLMPQEPYFIDIGTGGGFPGIPFTILTPQATGVLVDSVSKKVKAVNNFVKLLKLNDRISTSDQRCEDIARLDKNPFNLVLARAVAPLPVLIEYAAPLLQRNGYAVFSKGNPSDEELKDADYAAEICGCFLLQKEFITLPENAGERSLFIYQKIKDSAINLPRRNGVATKKPLGL